MVSFMACELLNAGSGQGDSDNVITFEFELVLHIGGSGELDGRWALALECNTLANEVTHFEHLTVDGSVDGEVIVYETHLVSETLGKTDHHVVDVRADSADGGKLLALGEPHVNTDFAFVSHDLDIYIQVLEITGELTTGALNSDYTGLGFHGAAILDGEVACTEQGLHGA